MTALLDAAGDLDRAGRLREGHGRALLATLTLAGLRIDGALSLRWEDVNLATYPGAIRVRRSKTEAGKRTVMLLPFLRDELTALKARRQPERTALVFGTIAAGRTARATSGGGSSRGPSSGRARRSGRRRRSPCRIA